LLGKQLIAIVGTLTFSLCVTYLILRFVDATIGLRVAEEEEMSGLDLSQHSEVSYIFSENGNGSHVTKPVA